MEANEPIKFETDPALMGKTVGGYRSEWIHYWWRHGRRYRTTESSGGYNQFWRCRVPTGETIHATVFWWPDDNGVYQRCVTLNYVREPGQTQPWEEPDHPANLLLAQIDAEKPIGWHPWQEPIPPLWRAKRKTPPRKPWGRNRDAEPFPLPPGVRT